MNAGIMGYEPMRDLPFPEYLKITKYRQSESAKRTNEMQRNEFAEEKASAKIMRASGHTYKQIAQILKFHKNTISNWLK